MVGELESADLARQGAGEGASLAAEQLALDQGRRDRGAVDPHHRPRVAPAQLMDPGGEEFLAGAGLAKEQHGCVGGGDALDLGEHRPDRLALADDGLEAAPLLDLAFERDVLEVELVTEADDFLERRLVFGDVEAGADVPGELAAGEIGGAIVEHPAPLSVTAAEPVLHLERAPGVEARLVGVDAGGEILGMHTRHPSAADFFVERVADEFQPLPVEPRGPLVGTADPDHHVGLIGDRLEALLARLERGARPLAAEGGGEDECDQAQALEPAWRPVRRLLGRKADDPGDHAVDRQGKGDERRRPPAPDAVTVRLGGYLVERPDVEHLPGEDAGDRRWIAATGRHLCRRLRFARPCLVMRETEMLAVGGAEEDGTVIELERIEETAHRALDLIVHVVMVDGNQLGHELVELNRFFEGPPALTCGNGLQSHAGGTLRLGPIWFTHRRWSFTRHTGCAGRVLKKRARSPCVSSGMS